MKFIKFIIAVKIKVIKIKIIKLKWFPSKLKMAIMLPVKVILAAVNM